MNEILKPRQPCPQISEQERQRRKASIDVARGSVRLEGFILSPEVERINHRFIDGELTRQEHIAAIKSIVRYEGATFISLSRREFPNPSL